MTDPFTLSMIIIVALTLMGASVGLSMIAGSFLYLAATYLYLAAKGFDTSIAAKTMLQGLFNGQILCAIPLFIVGTDIMIFGNWSDRLIWFTQACRSVFAEVTRCAEIIALLPRGCGRGAIGSVS